MKSFRGFTLGLVLGLAAAFTTLGFAQNLSQTDKSKSAESCCAMQACCCHGDSCAMKEGDKSSANKASTAGHCCCCGGDSCDMKTMETKANDAKPKP